MSERIPARIRLWPWSYRGDEFAFWQDGVAIHWYGCPLFEVASDVTIIYPRRNEQFASHGGTYYHFSDKCHLLAVPHGIIASRNTQSENISTRRVTTRYGNNTSKDFYIESIGAVKQKKDNGQGTRLHEVIKAWNQFFDDCISSYTNDLEIKNIRKYGFKGRIPWHEVQDIILKISGKADEPHMALIVYIAEQMRHKLSMVVNGARKILLRERRLLSADRISEMDKACLQWFAQQPGKNAASKAAMHRQQLQGIARKETYNTLENRVLLDFILRCKTATQQYLQAERSNFNKQSKRITDVNAFQNLCQDLLQKEIFFDVQNITGRVMPNYVLQSDIRYREVWDLYCRLLRQEEQESRAWDWQSRTWADIVRTLVGVSLFGLEKTNNDFELSIKPGYTSSIQLLWEQIMGRRANRGTEPGPFYIYTKKSEPEWVLSVVHCDLANEHQATQNLSITGGHLYLVLERIEGTEKRVIVVWAVHTASSNENIIWDDVSASAYDALKNYSYLSRKESLKLTGIIFADSIDIKTAELQGDVDAVPIILMPAEPQCWGSDLDNLRYLFYEFLKKALS